MIARFSDEDQIVDRINFAISWNTTEFIKCLYPLKTTPKLLIGTGDLVIVVYNSVYSLEWFQQLLTGTFGCMHDGMCRHYNCYVQLTCREWRIAVWYIDTTAPCARWRRSKCARHDLQTVDFFSEQGEWPRHNQTVSDVAACDQPLWCCDVEKCSNVLVWGSLAWNCVCTSSVCFTCHCVNQ